MAFVPFTVTLATGFDKVMHIPICALIEQIGHVGLHAESARAAALALADVVERVIDDHSISKSKYITPFSRSKESSPGICCGLTTFVNASL